MLLAQHKRKDTQIGRVNDAIISTTKYSFSNIIAQHLFEHKFYPFKFKIVHFRKYSIRVRESITYKYVLYE